MDAGKIAALTSIFPAHPIATAVSLAVTALVGKKSRSEGQIKMDSKV